ncbi:MULTISPECIES: hypothetical protein [unclassified Streptomyces]|uniref:hypothetical protein n=1 Tax=unclassified Streptomyces TaxID=2593676 RepID=UPI0038024C9B
MITVTPADTTDRDAARELLWRLRGMQPQITQVWADSVPAHHGDGAVDRVSYLATLMT